MLNYRRICGGAAAVMLAAVAVHAAEMSVQVRQGDLRAKPSFLSSIEGQVAYGDRVSVLQERSGWMEISFKGKTGWIHGSALTQKKVVLQSGDQDTVRNASGEELALAGKGFNAEVEAEYKTRNPEADFAAVDRMEKIRVTPEEACDFLQEGGVIQDENGGAQ